jgi:hypothetical protein
MPYTVTTTATPLLVGTASTTWVYKVQSSQGGILVIRGAYTKGDETATAFKVSTRATQAGTDTPIYKVQVGTDNTHVQLQPTYTASARFEIAVPVFAKDKFIGITPTATGSATGTIAFDYADMQ